MENIFQMLQTSYSLEDIVRLSDVKNVRERAKLQSAGYHVDFTRVEWQRRFPHIPPERIVVPKTNFLFSGPMYYDPNHGICFATNLFGGQIFTGQTDAEFESALLQQVEHMQLLHEQREYLRLLAPCLTEGSGNIAMRLVFDLLHADGPSEALYHAFVEVYSFCDCGAALITRDALDLTALISEKSKAQKAATLRKLKQFPNEITVYRGEGSESTPYLSALSWTTDLEKAYFFASWRGGESARIVKGTIAKCDVLEYISDRGESEIVALPGAVTVQEVQKCVSLDDFWAAVTHPVFLDIPHVNDTLGSDAVKSARLIYDGLNRSGDHDAAHTERVCLMVLYLFRSAVCAKYVDATAQEKQRVGDIFQKLMTATLWHDTGRTDDTSCSSHGQAGYDLWKLESQKDDEIIFFLTKYHSLPDKMGRAYFQSELSHRTDSSIIWDAYCVLKDADALDRWRFGATCSDFLNMSTLRLKESKLLIPVAAKLQHVNFA